MKPSNPLAELPHWAACAPPVMAKTADSANAGTSVFFIPTLPIENPSDHG
jgi:hypothetical protein